MCKIGRAIKFSLNICYLIIQMYIEQIKFIKEDKEFEKEIRESLKNRNKK